jgi:uncharacterized membrane protein YdjX (TVP38/TMEM64 family)
MHALMETFTHAVEWLRAQGPATLPLAFLVFVLANAAMAPASVLTVALGFVYGFVPGFLVAVLARPSAGIVACMVGRTLLRTRVQAVADRYPVFTAVDRALSSGGMRVIVLLRLSPLISSTVVNWLLGLTRVTLRDFAIGSALGIIPSTLAYTYLGSGLSAAREIFSERKEDPFHTALLVLGLIATWPA